MVQMKEYIKAPKIELSDEEIANLSDAELKTLVIDTHRTVWVWLQNRGKSKGYAEWNKENTQGTNSEGKENSTQINNLEQKEEINSQSEQNEETRIQKNERLRNLQDIFKHSSIQIIGVPEGEEEEQEIENLFEQIMKEKFPSLAKKIDFQEVQKTQRVPTKLDPKKHIPRHIKTTLPKIKDK